MLTTKSLPMKRQPVQRERSRTKDHSQLSVLDVLLNM